VVAVVAVSEHVRRVHGLSCMVDLWQTKKKNVVAWFYHGMACFMARFTVFHMTCIVTTKSRGTAHVAWSPC
jgi:hypothetical protein